MEANFLDVDGQRLESFIKIVTAIDWGAPGGLDVVIVTSDHGFCRWFVPGHEISTTEFRAPFDSPSVSPTPGKSGVFPRDVADVNVFFWRSSAYFSLASEFWSCQAWPHEETGFLEAEPRR